MLTSWLLLGALSCNKKADPATTSPPTNPVASTFTNPLLPSGPDPWVYQKDGSYYYMATTGGNLTIRKTAKMSELGSGVSYTVWTPTANAANSHDIWAPELHFLDGKWYIYYTAGPGSCCGGQRSWVLENANTDPTQGTWTDKGRLANPVEDNWSIDGTILELNGTRYYVWSGWPGATDGEQRIYISRMSNPWTLTGPRVQLSRPELGWETNGYPKTNEGPEALQHNGKTFIVYSASHCSTDDYTLGLLTLTGTDPMDATAWTKSQTPVLVKNAANHAYGPGHNSFFKSKDGTQDWIIYHANTGPNQGCGDVRNPRMQQFTWNADGTPNFGTPVATGQALARPSGE
jgi:GH43 family beta-xylosidase